MRVMSREVRNHTVHLEHCYVDHRVMGVITPELACRLRTLDMCGLWRGGKLFAKFCASHFVTSLYLLVHNLQMFLLILFRTL